MTPSGGGAPESQAPAGPGRNWTRLLLIFSVALNLLFVGALGAHLLRSDTGRRDSGWSMGRDFVRGLPRERRQTILEAFGDHREEFRDRRRAIGEARRQVSQALRSGERSDIVAAFSRLADKEAEATREFREIIAEISASLTVEERERFARQIERHRRSSRRGRDGD